MGHFISQNYHFQPKITFFERNCSILNLKWSILVKLYRFLTRNEILLSLKIHFFRNSQKFAQFRSKIHSNHWVPSSTVQLRKYVEREFKMRLMIALIKFSRVKFEILKFLANFNFWSHVSNTCWSESQCENFF